MPIEEFLFKHFVIEKSRSLKADCVGLRDVSYNFGRIKKPVAIMFPVLDEVSKVFGNATANGIDIENLGRVKPLKFLAYAFCHVAGRNHASQFTLAQLKP